MASRIRVYGHWNVTKRSSSTSTTFQCDLRVPFTAPQQLLSLFTLQGLKSAGSSTNVRAIGKRIWHNLSVGAMWNCSISKTEMYTAFLYLRCQEAYGACWCLNASICVKDWTLECHYKGRSFHAAWHIAINHVSWGSALLDLSVAGEQNECSS